MRTTSPAAADGEYGSPDDPPPESPTLTVTQGHIRFHLLQGNSSNGPGGRNFNPDTGMGVGDPNGTDIIFLEVWQVGTETCPQEGDPDYADTYCTGMSVTGPPGGGTGTYTITGSGMDETGDTVLFSFSADNGQSTVFEVGPQESNVAEIDLGAGRWTLRVTADDDPDCPDEAFDSTCVQQTTSAQGLLLRGDTNQDGGVDISDAICVLNFLFVGGPCNILIPDCLDAADANDSGAVDISDGVTILSFLFQPGGTELPGPFPFCGRDGQGGSDDTDSLGCERHRGCG